MNRRELGGAVAGAVAFMAAGGCLAIPEAPDAEIVRLAERHIRIERVLRTARHLPDEHPIWEALEASCLEIGQAKPRSMTGVLAKARAAKVTARRPDGSEDPHGTVGEIWAWELLNDVLRLAGATA